MLFLAYLNKSSYLCNRNQTNSHRKYRLISKKSNLNKRQDVRDKRRNSNLKDNAI